MFEDMKWRGFLREINELLELERKSLLEGDLTRTLARGGRREALLDKLSAMPEEAVKTHEPAIATLRAAAARNHRLLKAYLSGVASAARIMGEIDATSQNIGAYQRDGSKMPEAGPSRLSRA